MRNLINFLIKYNYWLVFLGLELICFVLMFRFNRYQGSVFFTSVNELAASVYETTSSVSSYFNLRSENEKLMDRNIQLQAELAGLKTIVAELGKDTVSLLPSQYQTFKARVINNSINKDDNYITLDKGAEDGIAPDMGVIGAGGVVGIVYLVSENRSLVVSVLNSKASISCKVRGSNYFGNLKWTGGDSKVATLFDMPNHAEVAEGDTIVTSGFSSVFPEGLPLGTVKSVANNNDGLSYIVKVDLSTDFGNISDVRVFRNNMGEEQTNLEETVKGK